MSVRRSDVLAVLADGEWKSALEIEKAIRLAKGRRRAPRQLVDRVLRSLEITKEVSMVRVAGLPIWRIAPRIDDSTRARRLAAASRDRRAFRASGSPGERGVS